MGALLAAWLSTAPGMTAASPARACAAAAGRRIDIELQDAEIHAVLDLFADIGNVNIVAGKGVEGRVTVKFYDMPWDEALAHILVALDLRMHRDGNVIYVVPTPAR